MYPDDGYYIQSPSWGAPAFKIPQYNLSRESLYNKIRSDIRGSEVNLGTMLGEYAESAETFLQIAETVASRGRNLVRRHPTIRGAKSVEKTLASAHLQWTYGMKPLAQDLGQSAAEIKVGVQTKPPYLEGVVKRKDRVQYSAYKNPNTTIAPTLQAKVEGIREVRMRTKYRATYNSNGFLQTLAAHGLLNPLSVAWELMPYSFVIDWFFNVGEGLASLDNYLIFSNLSVIDSTSNRTYEYITPVSSPYITGNPTMFRYSRTDNRSSPTGISMIVSPAYKPGRSMGHFLNGLALLSMARGKL